MMDLSSYREISHLLEECLKLRQHPVAVCFSNALPEPLMLNAGRFPAGCRFWQEGAGRVVATSADDHQLCAIGVYTHNLEPSASQQIDLTDALQVFAELGYVRTEDLASIPVVGERHRYIVYAPLADTPLPPDVVLVFVDAAGSLILTEAAQQVEMQPTLAMGRPACAVVACARDSGRAALSLGCCGARAYLDILTDEVALFALPGPKLGTYAARIKTLSEANSALSSFHRLRRRAVETGGIPTVKQSLVELRGAH